MGSNMQKGSRCSNKVGFVVPASEYTNNVLINSRIEPHKVHIIFPEKVKFS